MRSVVDAAGMACDQAAMFDDMPATWCRPALWA